MSTQPSSDELLPGMPVYYHPIGGNMTRAKVVRVSKSGKRVQIEYLWHPSWTAGKEVSCRCYVKPTSLSLRHD
jgi:hypothetical protein